MGSFRIRGKKKRGVRMRGFVRTRGAGAGAGAGAFEMTDDHGTAAAVVTAAGNVVDKGEAGNIEMRGFRGGRGGGGGGGGEEEEEIEEDGLRAELKGTDRKKFTGVEGEYNGNDRAEKTKMVDREVVGGTKDEVDEMDLGEEEAEDIQHPRAFNYDMSDAPRPISSSGRSNNSISKLAKGQIGIGQAHARKSGPLSLHTSDFDGYEGTETEVLGLEDLIVDGFGAGCENALNDDNADFSDGRDIEPTHDEDEDEDEDAVDVDVVENDGDSEDDDNSVDGANATNAADVRRNDANEATSVNVALIEYYRQKELAEMRNGDADKGAISSNVNSLVKGQPTVMNTNYYTGTRLYAKTTQLRNGRYHDEDGLLDSYPSTTITGVGDIDDVVLNGKGTKGHKVYEEASNNHVQGGYIDDQEGDEEGSGSHDTECEQMQQHPSIQGRRHYNVHFDVQTSPLRNQKRPEGRNMRGLRVFRQNSPTSAPLVPGYVQDLNNDGQHDADFDLTHTNHYDNLNESFRNGFQAVGQSHLDMTAFIQRAGRSKRGQIKYTASQVDARKLNDATTVAHNAVVNSNSRYATENDNAQSVSMVPVQFSRTHDARTISRVIPRRIPNGEAIIPFGQMTTAAGEAARDYSRAVTSTKANTKLKSNSKKALKTAMAPQGNKSHQTSRTNDMSVSQQLDSVDGFTSAEAEDEENETEEKEKNEDLDYEREKLFEMNYEELERESFDHTPDAVVTKVQKSEAKSSTRPISEASSSSPSPAPSSSKHDTTFNKRKPKADHRKRQQEEEEKEQQQSHSRKQYDEIKSKLNSTVINAETLQTILPSIPHQTTTDQSTFYGSLSLSDWDIAGDFLVDELAATLKQFKAARAEKREMARTFEDEVGRRYSEVREESERVGRRVKELRIGGEGLLGGGGVVNDSGVSGVVVDGGGGDDHHHVGRLQGKNQNIVG